MIIQVRDSGLMRKLFDRVFDTVIALPDWLRAGRVDLEQLHQRRQTSHYLARKRRVKTLWIIAGIIMLLHPKIHFIVLIGLLTTFLSFAILDDS